ncbi:unnamed protein product [marine sediment metagenome]|uniref:Uncharacterized protein n=1 Tax=marine sediment metagenome TaxID=412755 RepID=X0W5Z9_9ZZZZ
MSGAVVVIHQNRLMRRFRDAKATDLKAATTLADIGCRNSWVFRRMVARGVFIETMDGRFYMDEEAARQFVKLRWRTMIVFLAVVIVLFAILQIFIW